MKNSKNLTVLIIVGLCLLLVYVQVRQRSLKKIQGELATATALRNQQQAANLEVAELVRRFGSGADVPTFVEQMHRNSRQLGIAADYELSSSQKNSAGSRRGGATPATAGTNLVVSRMRVSLAGEYRNVAEYLHLLQKDRNPKKIIDLKIAQQKGIPVLNMNLELYSYRGDNGA